MLSKSTNPFKRIAIDIAGYTLVILSGLLGWLPGPGGMPLLFAGLGLLSIHNKWAKNLIEYLKVNGLKLAERIFPDHKIIALVWDVVFILLVGLAGYSYSGLDGILQTLIGAGSLALALYIFSLNRKRFEKIITKLKKTKQ